MFSEKLIIGLNLKNVNFLKSDIIFLGHKISQNGIQPDPGKIKSIENLPYPRNVNEIKSCLGFFSYFRKFIPNFSGIASPLNALTKKKYTF